MSVMRDKITGKWMALYYIKDGDGKLVKKVKKGFKYKGDAEAYELSHKSNSIDTSALTFGELFKLYSKANQANNVTSGKREASLKRYASGLWNRKVEKISKADLIRWKEDLAEESLSTTTKNDIIGFVKQTFRYGYEVYDLYDPSKILKSIPKGLNDFHQVNIINFEQFSKLLDCEQDAELKRFFIFLFMTGCRIGEARALTNEDFNGHGVHIYKAMRRYEDSLGPTKTRTQRWIELDDMTIDICKLQSSMPGKYLFGGETPMSLTTIRKHFKDDLKKSGLPDMRIHDLRHSNVSMLWAANVPIPEISKRIGHSTPKTTMEVYSHIFDNNQTESLKYLNSLKVTTKVTN